MKKHETIEIGPNDGVLIGFECELSEELAQAFTKMADKWLAGQARTMLLTGGARLLAVRRAREKP